MPADVMKALHLATLITPDDDGFTEEIERMKIPRPRHVVQVANELPALAKHSPFLDLEEFRVVVDPGGQAQRLLIGIGWRDALELSAAGCCIHGAAPLRLGGPAARVC